MQNWRRSECEARGPEPNFANRVSRYFRQAEVSKIFPTCRCRDGQETRARNFSSCPGLSNNVGDTGQKFKYKFLLPRSCCTKSIPRHVGKRKQSPLHATKPCTVPRASQTNAYMPRNTSLVFISAIHPTERRSRTDAMPTYHKSRAVIPDHLLWCRLPVAVFPCRPIIVSTDV